MLLRLAASLAVMLLAVVPQSGAAVALQCPGRDVLEDLRLDSPPQYRQVMAAAREITNGEANLWRLEKEGVAPSYLLGTLHSADPRMTIGTRLAAVLNTSKSLAVEVADLSAEAMQAAMSKSRGLAVFQDADSSRWIERRLSPPNYEKARTFLERAGVPQETVPKVRPWLAYSMVQRSDCERRYRSAGNKVFDLKLVEAAKRKGMPVHSLESIEEQFSSLASVPDDDQLDMLRAALAIADRAEDFRESMIRRYKRREMSVVWPLQLEFAQRAGISAESFQGYRKAALVQRNIRFRDRSRALLAKGNALIAVGALHVVGEDGMVDLYRREGWRVSPVE